MKRIFLFLAAMLLFFSGTALAGSPVELVVMTHDSFSVSKEVIEKFEADNGVKVKFLKAGDAGAALNQAILSKNNPMADIFYGVDNTYLSRALKSGIFESYKSPGVKDLADELKLDPSFMVTPVDFGDVCLNYDKKWFREHGKTPPTSLEDLVKPEFKGLTVVENPATSSPGLAFLLATIGHFGEKGYIDYWKKLAANDVLVTNGWKEAYWGHFTAASEGLRPIVVSYASSPPVEVLYAKEKLDEAPTAAVTGNGSAYRQIEFAGILKGTGKRALAEKFMDFLISPAFQEDIPLQMFVFPANKKAKLPELFIKHTTVSKDPSVVDADRISKMRMEWIEDWTDAVLR